MVEFLGEGGEESGIIEVKYHRGAINFTYNTESCATLSGIKRCIDYDYRHVIGDNFIEVRVGYYGEQANYIYDDEPGYEVISSSIMPEVVLSEVFEDPSTHGLLPRALGQLAHEVAGGHEH